MRKQKPGLIVYSHGSKRKSWGEPFRDIAGRLEESLSDRMGPPVQVAFLEGTGPSLWEAVDSMRRAGVNRWGILPLFLTPSVHLLEDVPETFRAVQESLHPDESLTQVWQRPLSESIANGTLDRARRGVPSPGETCVVLPYYGSDKYRETWDTLLARMEHHLLQGGFKAVLAAPVGHIVGASTGPTTAAIQQGLHIADRVRIVPFLLSPGIFQHEKIPEAIAQCTEDEQRRVTYFPDGILPDRFVEAEILAAAQDFLLNAEAT